MLTIKIGHVHVTVLMNFDNRIGKGTPAVATTARYTQPNREQMKHKLNHLSL